jgi:fructokinase
MRVGIDLGGTKIELVVLDDRGTLCWRRRVDTPQGDYAATVDAIVQLVRAAECEVGDVTSVGLGTPGALSQVTGLIKNSNSVCLNGKPLDRDVARALGRDVRIANDANCFALSEATDGAAAGAAVVFGVIVGTGTGGGIVVNGRILSGANAIAGEWGHNPLPWPRDEERPGPDCYCGKQGCIETFLSGPALANDHFRHSGEHLTARDIARLDREGDAAAGDTLARYEDRMARALAGVINILDPDVIVLGGGVSNIDRLYDNVPLLLPRYVFSDHVATRLAKARHGDASGVRGAAWL